MSWFTVGMIVIGALIFLIALLLVRVNEGFDEDEMLYIEARRKLKSEYYRSLRLNEQMKVLKTEMDWHKSGINN